MTKDYCRYDGALIVPSERTVDLLLVYTITLKSVF